MLLEVTNLQKSFETADKTKIEILKNISFNVSKAQTIAIVGVSGSGKSTLLSLLATLDKPDAGHIKLNNLDVTYLSEKDLIQTRSTIGIVFQQFHLVQYLTALENISLPLEIMKKDNIKERSLAVIENVGLSHRKNHFPSQMSGGECQRTAIARSIVMEPQILLADEPTGNLDSGNGEKVAELMFNLVEKNKMALILVSHNWDLVVKCQTVYKLVGGCFEFVDKISN